MRPMLPPSILRDLPDFSRARSQRQSLSGAACGQPFHEIFAYGFRPLSVVPVASRKELLGEGEGLMRVPFPAAGIIPHAVPSMLCSPVI